MYIYIYIYIYILYVIGARSRNQEIKKSRHDDSVIQGCFMNTYATGGALQNHPLTRSLEL